MIKKIALFTAALAIWTVSYTQTLVLNPNQATGDEVPLHSGIITGKLENGMHYFILPNHKPEKKVELRLAVNAGSLQESDEQQGLAHFCEHMAFNGTTHFEKNELVDYLQSAGVKFGAHLNAYTSFDETVYMLSLPTEDVEVVEKGFLVLQDWASNLLFNHEEIDKERGVVLEEYRIGLGADKRMMENYLPLVFKDSRYAVRLPIGKEEILKNFPYNQVEDFYKEWYRPELMAVIVVGDIEPVKAEELINTYLGSITASDLPKIRENYPIPDHEEILVSVNSDAEATYNRISLFIKTKGERKVTGSTEEYKEALRYRLIFDIINERIDILTQQGGAPVSYAWMSMGEMWGARSKNALQASALVSDEKYQEAIELIYTELLKAKVHGFSEGELKRARERMMNSLENNVKEQDKTPSSRLTYGIIDHFLTGASFPDPGWSFDFANVVFEETTTSDLKNMLEEVNLDQNTVLVITGSEESRPNMPAEPSVLNIIREVLKKPVDPPAEDNVADALMKTPVNRGKSVSSKAIDAIDAKSFTLSNGVQVAYKSTDLKNDQILFTALSKGGTSLYSDEEYNGIRFGLDVIGETGIGEFSKIDLDKMLSGKNVRLSPGISSYEERIGGSCSPDDLELFFQMIHLQFKAPRYDEDAYNVFVGRQKSLMKNMLSNPSTYFSLKWQEHLYPGCNRNWTLPSEEDWSKTSYKEIDRVYRERFANAADFNFYFVGNIDEHQLKDLAELYLGTLVTKPDAKESIRDVSCKPKAEAEKLTVEKGKDAKSTVRILYTGEAEYSKEESLKLEMISEILTIKLTETLREEMSGVYGSGASGWMTKIPYGRYQFSISFPCGPENAEALTAAAIEQVGILIQEGPAEKDLQKAIETKVKEIKDGEQNNGYWLNLMSTADRLGVSVSEILVTEKEVRALTTDQLKKTASDYLGSSPYIGMLMPETK